MNLKCVTVSVKTVCTALHIKKNEIYKLFTHARMFSQWSAVVGTSPHSDKIIPTQTKITITISHYQIQIHLYFLTPGLV